MISQDDILSLIEQIYDAAADPSQWKGFLGNFVRAMGSTVGALTLHDTHDQSGSMEAAAFLDPAWMAPYRDHFAAINVHITRAAARGLARPGLLITGEMAIPNQELLRTEFYNDFLKPQNLQYILGGMISQQDSMMSLISTHRSPAQGPFEEKELQMASLLMPHLSRAARLHQLTTNLRRERDLAVDCLDRTKIGFLVVDESSKILMLNAYAEAIVQQNDGVSAKGKRLQINDPSAYSKVSAAVKGAAASRQELIARRSTIAVNRPSLRRPYLLSIYPLRPNSKLFDKSQPAAGISIVDPESRGMPPAAVFSQMFGLTSAEARLALRLLQGRTLEESAADLKVSRNTVRTQLRQVLAKTGTRRQSELIRLLTVLAMNADDVRA